MEMKGFAFPYNDLPDVTPSEIEYNLGSLSSQSTRRRRAFTGASTKNVSPLDPDMGKPLLVTIFSASDYGGSGNYGAYLQISGKKLNNKYHLIEDQFNFSEDLEDDLYYEIVMYKFYSNEKGSIKKLEMSNISNLQATVLRKKQAFQFAFAQADNDNRGFISKQDFSKIMSEITGLYAR